MSDELKLNWYQKLLSQLNRFTEEFELDDVQADKFRTFVIDLARTQFKSGTKSGAAWVHKQHSQKQAAVQT